MGRRWGRGRVPSSWFLVPGWRQLPGSTGSLPVAVAQERDPPVAASWRRRQLSRTYRTSVALGGATSSLPEPCGWLRMGQRGRCPSPPLLALIASWEHGQLARGTVGTAPRAVRSLDRRDWRDQRDWRQHPHFRRAPAATDTALRRGGRGWRPTPLHYSTISPLHYSVESVDSVVMSKAAEQPRTYRTSVAPGGATSSLPEPCGWLRMGQRGRCPSPWRAARWEIGNDRDDRATVTTETAPRLCRFGRFCRDVEGLRSFPARA